MVSRIETKVGIRVSMARYSRGKIAVLTLFRQVFKYKTSC